MSVEPIEKSQPVYFLGGEPCLNCREPVFAAEGADVMASSVRYRWTCDLCGHGFTTAARLLNEVPT
jgi:hypothetical protein